MGLIAKLKSAIRSRQESANESRSEGHGAGVTPGAAAPPQAPNSPNPARAEAAAVGTARDGPTLEAAEAVRREASAALQQGDLKKALQGYQELIRLRPSHAPAYVSLGFALGALGRIAEAEAALRRSLELDPSDFETHYFLGQNLEAQQLDGLALERYAASVELNPGFAHGWLALALLHERASRVGDARRAAHAASIADPSMVEAWHAAARLALRDDDAPAALAATDRWLRIAPGAALGLGMRADALLRLRRPAEALTAADGALAAESSDPVLWDARASALLKLGRPQEAAAAGERALSLSQPADLTGRELALAAALATDNRFEAALTMLDRVLSREPDHRDALHDRSLALLRLGRIDEALATLESALAGAPGDAKLTFALGVTELYLGRWAAGWAHYEARESPPVAASLPGRRWDSQDVAVTDRILLTSEQGLGDTLQFLRYAPAVAARAKEVVLQVSPRVAGLLATTSARCRIVTDIAESGPVDLHAPLMSLPHLLGVPEPVQMSRPYVASDRGRRQYWNDRLTQADGTARRRIGLAWAGNPEHQDDRRRSLPLEHLRCHLAPLSDIQFVSLQLELRPNDHAAFSAWPGLLHPGTDQRDMADTAALIEELDLVVSVDTSVAHLAGAMGCPLLLLLMVCPDWRWGPQGQDSVWYPSARLVRQADHGNWESAVTQVRDLLRAWMAGGDAPAVRIVQ